VKAEKAYGNIAPSKSPAKIRGSVISADVNPCLALAKSAP